MKCNRYIFLIVLFPYVVMSQIDKANLVEPFFFSIIVQNIDTSIQWYSEVLDLTVLDKNEIPSRSLKMANLQGDNCMIELIESGSALPVAEALANSEGKSRMQGIFKIGFVVSGLNQQVRRWKELGVNSIGDIVKNPTSGKQMVIVRDPDGNRIQFFER